ncbi:IS1096 element passenger TnpR family protein [Pandoraea sputorum]|uniref:IS1096 element passenger TnpR family protein n=1 Tax=Pandoraea sputorum TaxID=93222 RepID=UPI0029663582|nr:hypothetical protein [Pandoraea sputorum]
MGWVLDPDTRRAWCRGGQKACVLKDLGGVPDTADFLEATTDSTHEAHGHVLEWWGASFDPAAFDLALAVTAQRRSRAKVGPSRRPRRHADASVCARSRRSPGSTRSPACRRPGGGAATTCYSCSVTRGRI